MSPATLVVTNDFPPRTGGIQSFVHQLVARQADTRIVVVAPDWPGAVDFDAAQTFDVVRYPRRLMLPTPDLSRSVARLVRQLNIETVVFGATAPLAGMAGRLRDAGATRVIGMTHGHESAWASTPGTREFISRAGRQSDCITYLGQYTRTKLAQAMDPADVSAMRQLVPGVDVDRFNPRNRANAVQLRHRYRLGDGPLIVCVSRLMPRKGQDMLIRALPIVRRVHPDARLVLAGSGPYRARLHKLAAEMGQVANVTFTGELPRTALPGIYALGDVFAMPCRTRNRGWDVEGLGIVYLEAAASGVPVIAGRSGGAPDAVLDEVTGRVVDGESRYAIAYTLIGLLSDPQRAAAMGRAGRDWVSHSWTWEQSAARFADLLAGIDPDIAHSR